MKRVPIVAIVGRSNVGKSSLFNAIARKGTAVVDDFAGVTRDRNYCLVRKHGFPFTVVDTGGLLGEEHDDLHSAVRDQAEMAISEADLVICMFDGMHGVHPQDREVVQILRKSNKPTIWVVNKCESPSVETTSAEFYALGIKELFTISAAHGVRVKELIAKIREELLAQGLVQDISEELKPAPRKEQQDAQFAEEVAVEVEEGDEPLAEENDPDTSAEESVNSESDEVLAEEVFTPKTFDTPIRIAIVGKPNTGKSTMINKIIGEDRLVVSNIAGTTRDSIEIPFKREGQEYTLIDTAGLRKKGRVEDGGIERFSNLRTLRALASCDVAVLLIDASEGVNEQDAKIAGLIHERGRGLIIAVNKWDLIEKDHRTVKDYERAVRASLKFCAYAPILFISGLTGRRCPNVLDTAKEVYGSARSRIPTSQVSKVLIRAFENKPAPSYRGSCVKIMFALQTSVAPPEFILFMDHPKGVNFSYERYLKNTLRKSFGFIGVDIRLHFKKRRDKGDPHEIMPEVGKRPS
jgi:GTP-binding protein